MSPCSPPIGGAGRSRSELWDARWAIGRAEPYGTAFRLLGKGRFAMGRAEPYGTAFCLLGKGGAHDGVFYAVAEDFFSLAITRFQRID